MESPGSRHKVRQTGLKGDLETRFWSQKAISPPNRVETSLRSSADLESGLSNCVGYSSNLAWARRRVRLIRRWHVILHIIIIPSPLIALRSRRREQKKGCSDQKSVLQHSETKATLFGIPNQCHAHTPTRPRTFGYLKSNS